MLMQISFRDRTDLYSINGWLFIRKEGGIVLGAGERTGIVLDWSMELYYFYFVS